MPKGALFNSHCRIDVDNIDENDEDVEGFVDEGSFDYDQGNVRLDEGIAYKQWTSVYTVELEDTESVTNIFDEEENLIGLLHTYYATWQLVIDGNDLPPEEVLSVDVDGPADLVLDDDEYLVVSNDVGEVTITVTLVSGDKITLVDGFVHEEVDDYTMPSIIRIEDEVNDTDILDGNTDYVLGKQTYTQKVFQLIFEELVGDYEPESIDVIGPAVQVGEDLFVSTGNGLVTIIVVTEIDTYMVSFSAGVSTSYTQYVTVSITTDSYSVIDDEPVTVNDAQLLTNTTAEVVRISFTDTETADVVPTNLAITVTGSIDTMESPLFYIATSSGSISVSLDARPAWGASKSLSYSQTTSFVGYTEDSLAYALIGPLDQYMIDGEESEIPVNTGKKIFTSMNETARTYVRNPDAWFPSSFFIGSPAANNFSPSNNDSPKRSGGLVTPRHLMQVDHFHLNVGNTIYFVTADNTTVSRVATEYRVIGGTDVSILTLDSDLPGTIPFYKVLPPDWQDYLPLLRPGGALPIVYSDQEKKILSRGLYSFGSLFQCDTPPSTSAVRQTYYEYPIGGDSGSPIFLFLDGEPLYIGAWTGNNAGYFVSTITTHINTILAMDGEYELTYADLTAYPNYD